MSHLDPPPSSDTRGRVDDDDGRQQLRMAESTIVESPLILLNFSIQKLREVSVWEAKS